MTEPEIATGRAGAPFPGRRGAVDHDHAALHVVPAHPERLARRRATAQLDPRGTRYPAYSIGSPSGAPTCPD